MPKAASEAVCTALWPNFGIYGTGQRRPPRWAVAPLVSDGSIVSSADCAALQAVITDFPLDGTDNLLHYGQPAPLMNVSTSAMSAIGTFSRLARLLSIPICRPCFCCVLREA